MPKVDTTRANAALAKIHAKQTHPPGEYTRRAEKAVEMAMDGAPGHFKAPCSERGAHCRVDYDVVPPEPGFRVTCFCGTSWFVAMHEIAVELSRDPQAKNRYNPLVYPAMGVRTFGLKPV